MKNIPLYSNPLTFPHLSTKPSMRFHYLSCLFCEHSCNDNARHQHSLQLSLTTWTSAGLNTRSWTYHLSFPQTHSVWLSWLDKPKFYVGHLAPEEHYLACKLGTVVTDNRRWLTSSFYCLLQEACNLLARYWKTHELIDYFTRVVIDLVQHSKPSTIAQLIKNKVHRPPLIAFDWHTHWLS